MSYCVVLSIPLSRTAGQTLKVIHLLSQFLPLWGSVNLQALLVTS